MRTLFFYVVAGACTGVSLIAGLVIGLIPFARPVLLVIGRWFWAPIFLWAGGVRLTVTGRPEALDLATPYVFVANHQGYMDIPAAFRAVRHRLRFVAKRELIYVPLLGFYMWRMGCPIVDRGQRDKAFAVMDRAVAQIKKGTPIVVYAEGTRTLNGRIGRFKMGGFVLAIKAGVPIVPLTIAGSFDVWNKVQSGVRPGPIEVHVGDPIPTGDLTLDDRHALCARVRAVIADQLQAMGGPAPDEEGASTEAASA